MSEEQPPRPLVGLLIETAKGHHEATGGVNPRWAHWYAERMVDDLNQQLDTSLDVDQLEVWLIAADVRYREQPREESWPKMYARWLIEEYRSEA